MSTMLAMNDFGITEYDVYTYACCWMVGSWLPRNVLQNIEHTGSFVLPVFWRVDFSWSWYRCWMAFVHVLKVLNGKVAEEMEIVENHLIALTSSYYFY